MNNRKKLFTSMAVVLALLMALAVGAWAAGNANKADLNLVLAPETQLDVYVDGTWSGELSDTYAFGDTATLSAPAVSGSKNFSHWTADGSIVSYSNPLKLTMNAHTTLYAVYANSVTAKPVAGFTSITRTNDGKSISFQAIASGTSAGIVYSTTATGNNLKIDGTGVTKVEAAPLTDSTATMPDSVLDDNNCWMLQITPASGDTVYHARAYVTVSGTTTYGDVKDVKLSDLQSGVSLTANLDGIDPQSDSTEQADLTNDLAGLANSMRTVTFDANGGTGTMAPQGVVSGTATKLNANTFTREGYTFNGWSTNKNGGGTTYTDGQSVTLTADTTLYAQWSSSNTYVVSTTFDNTISKTEHGTIKLEPEKAEANKPVKVTATPNAGYKLDELTVKDASGKEVELKKNEDGTYSFTQPNGKVTIEAKFAKEVKFADVPENSYYADAVDWAVEKGITNGVDENHFAPDATCTRAQAVTFLWRALGCPEPTSTKSEFTDVTDANAFYYKAVLWATENGVTNGIGDGSFGVNGIVNRAQMVTFMERAMKGKAETAESFTDVPEGAFYADAAAWAKENGVSEGIGDNKFGGETDCLRAQIVTMLYRYFVK